MSFGRCGGDEGEVVRERVRERERERERDASISPPPPLLLSPSHSLFITHPSKHPNTLKTLTRSKLLEPAYYNIQSTNLDSD